jgi:hypothetical protein
LCRAVPTREYPAVRKLALPACRAEGHTPALPWEVRLLASLALLAFRGAVHSRACWFQLYLGSESCPALPVYPAEARNPAYLMGGHTLACPELMYCPWLRLVRLMVGRNRELQPWRRVRLTVARNLGRLMLERRSALPAGKFPFPAAWIPIGRDHRLTGPKSLWVVN